MEAVVAPRLNIVTDSRSLLEVIFRHARLLSAGRSVAGRRRIVSDLGVHKGRICLSSLRLLLTIPIAVAKTPVKRRHGLRHCLISCRTPRTIFGLKAPTLPVPGEHILHLRHALLLLLLCLLAARV
jgi:hypothetical protein